MPEDIIALRHLLIIDENYNDDATDAFATMDSEDYNYIVYITEMLQGLMGDEKMVSFVKVLEAREELTA